MDPNRNKFNYVSQVMSLFHRFQKMPNLITSETLKQRDACHSSVRQLNLVGAVLMLQVKLQVPINDSINFVFNSLQV